MARQWQSRLAMVHVNKSVSLSFFAAFAFASAALWTTETKAFQFSGFEWDTKGANLEKVGPGPNRFRKENVWVDELGRLHMVIRRETDGVWSCSEVIMQSSVGYGTYTMRLDTPIDDFDPQAVLGFFTWSHPTPNNEMDIEIARFQGARGPNLFFSVQPKTNAFDISGKAWDQSEHTFKWMARAVEFTSFPLGPGGSGLPPITSRMTTGVPTPNRTTTPRINFWLRGGAKPSNLTQGQMEVVISAVEFVGD